MRLKSELWVKAYLRRCHGEGVEALLARRGDADAGAIYIKVARLDGTAQVYGPAPAGFDREEADRLWVPLFATAATAETACDTYLERQVDFDSDAWIVVVEDRQGRHFLDDWLMPA